MNPQIIIALVIALAGFGGGFGTAWKIQNGIQAEQEVKHAEQKLADERLSAAETLRRADAVTKAQNAANARAVQLRKDADGARSALVGLHGATEAAMRNAETSHAACIDRTRTYGELLNQCGESYRSMAEIADRHASDAATLTASWPK